MKVIGGVEGTAPGEFAGSHAIALDSRGRLFVLERQEEVRNPRIQILEQNGRFIEEWTDLAGLGRPSGITISADDTVYIGESEAENITIVKEGRVIEWIAGLEAAPHNITRDAGTGDLYLADSNLPGAIKKIMKK